MLVQISVLFWFFRMCISEPGSQTEKLLLVDNFATAANLKSFCLWLWLCVYVRAESFWKKDKAAADIWDIIDSCCFIFFPSLWQPGSGRHLHFPRSDRGEELFTRLSTPDTKVKVTEEQRNKMENFIHLLVWIKTPGWPLTDQQHQVIIRNWRRGRGTGRTGDFIPPLKMSVSTTSTTNVKI